MTEFDSNAPADSSLLGTLAHDLPRIEAIIDSLAEGMIVADTQGDLLAANKAYVRMVGFTRHEDLRRSLMDLARWVELRDLSGRELPLSEWPLSRALAGETFTDVQLRLRRRDGFGEFIGSYNGSMAHDGDGAPTLAVLTVRDITAQKQTEAALEAAYRREKLLNEIGQAIRSTLDPREVQTVAVRALGQALLADRCYMAQIDFAEQKIDLTEDWRRDDLFPITGSYALADLSTDIRTMFDAGRVLVAPDVQIGPWPADTAAALGRLGIRALVNVPFFNDGTLVAVIGAAMTDEAREWTDEEIALTEAVAMQTRTAVEAARVALREHNIAVALQQTLQLDLPEQTPGLQIADYYRAALAEAEIGGDFCDIFTPEEGRHILVIGDVSGKGLAAAAQVAAVRNMLRCVIYQGLPLAVAIATLNGMLSAQNLLLGFVTLCVCQYTSADHTLTYVSCGHEPLLLRHAATRHVETLGPTGPPLGLSTDAVYTEAARRLQSGDALVMYTDGLSESGPTRQELLGVEGLANLLRGHPMHEDARSLCRRIVAGVERHERGPMRDDACILTVRVL